MRRHAIFLIVLALGLVSASPALAARGGERGSPIEVDLLWADGELLGTILQTDLPYNGNEGSYDRLFLVEGQPNPVAEAAPGDADYNGGRWLPTHVAYDGSMGVLTSYDDLVAAVGAGAATIGEPDHAAAFLCPVIPNH